MQYEIKHGDCLELLRDMPENSIDAIVTDPPYGLSFMGKKWDYDIPSVDIWRECLRVLKPGGHLLSFAGTRTQHRMACAIEDAGFEVRDMIAWVYGSGFPKSLDVGKAIDKCNGEPNRLHKFTAWMRTTGLTARQLDEITNTNMGGHYLTAASQPAIPTAALWSLIRPHCADVPAWVDQLVERIEAEREVLATETRYNEASGIVSAGRDERTLVERKITAASTDAARQWQGWGTALKPALEPITVARKPLTGTVAANVLEHGTGALNVDGCRVGTDAVTINTWDDGAKPFGGGAGRAYTGRTVEGRWPANLIHDGSDDATELLGGAARFFYCAKASKRDRDEGCESIQQRLKKANGSHNGREDTDDLSARWQRKARNHHPTVKPTDLMRYLCRLVTPPGGIVLDPFMGSGSTGKAAMLERFRFIGIERELEYGEIAKARIEAAKEEAAGMLL